VRGVRERVDRGRRRCIVRNMVASVHLLGIVGNTVYICRLCVLLLLSEVVRQKPMTDPAN
jgi:hypothetical protein